MNSITALGLSLSPPPPQLGLPKAASILLSLSHSYVIVTAAVTPFKSGLSSAPYLANLLHLYGSNMIQLILLAHT
jgi:hypothetical protein